MAFENPYNALPQGLLQQALPAERTSMHNPTPNSAGVIQGSAAHDVMRALRPRGERHADPGAQLIRAVVRLARQTRHGHRHVDSGRRTDLPLPRPNSDAVDGSDKESRPFRSRPALGISTNSCITAAIVSMSFTWNSLLTL
ncbi:hypothetical protein [Paracoccus mutanolyticus]|uniref:hypothetical protein n=1 Tax=Paracoccus mutanolyticus TaxID=1499308 RepID=UPI0016734D50|nr:hypothetical protein [Paracoccus mutanolyticus]